MNRLRRLFHRHRWETVEVAHGTTTRDAIVTVLLQRCTCGGYRTENVNGHWPTSLFTNKGE